MKHKLLSGLNLRAILAFFFLSYIPIGLAQYCNTSFSNVNWEFITNVSFGGINNTTAGNTGGPVNYTSQVANVSAGGTYTLSVTIDPDGNDYVFVYIDWNQNGTLNDAGESYTLASNVGTAGPYTQSITVPGGAVAGNTRMRVICQFNNTTMDPCVSQTYGEAEDYTVNVSTSACSGTPTPGNTTATSTTVCPSANFTLGTQNATVGTGVTYQWQSSANGVTYTNISGATNSMLTTSQTSATYYQVIVTCGGGTPATSTPIQVNMNSFLNCYCTSSANYIYDEDITNVTLGTLNNTSNCGTAAPGAGSVLNQYSNFTGVTAPSLARTASYGLSVGIGGCSYAYSNETKVYIDYNQNGLFTDPGEMVYASPALGNGAHVESASITIPVTAALGTTRMRVITMQSYTLGSISSCGTYGYGETEDYYVTIAAAPTCPQPTAVVWLAGTTSSAQLAWTPGGTETAWEVEYGAPGFTPGSGTTVPVTGGTPQTTIPGLTANTFFQAYVRAVCSPTDESFNAGPVSFNTYGYGQYMEADTDCGTGFVDISGNATATNLNLTDDTEYGISTMPFPVYFQGTIVTSATIGNNGGIKFNTTTADVNYEMNAPGVYPYVQDLGTATDGGVFMEVLGTAPNRKLVVQWQNVPHYQYPPVTDGATFEVIFDEATAEIYYHYADLEMSNPSWTNGADAEIGVRGPQNINISMNSNTYLSQNECVHLYYTDCPKPKNLTFSNITSDEFSMDWVAGPSNETEWIVEYGTAGGTMQELTDITSSDQQISSLTPITAYTVNVYAVCANGQTSAPLTAVVQTLPLCSDPYALYATSTAEDSIKTSWQWTETVLPLQGFNLKYGPAGFDLYGTSAIYEPANGTNFADTIDYAGFMAGATYQVYVQAVCPSGTGTDTSNYVGPFTVTMPVTNDTVCYAEMLMTDGTVYTFTNNGATVVTATSNPEQAIAPPNTGLQTTTGWGNSTITNSTWFTFVAPASGNVRISGKNVGYDGQMAVYKVGNCANFTSFQLVAANDNEIGGTSLAPNFTVCGLIPGSTYYLLHDPYNNNSTGTYSIKISAINLEAGSAGSLLEVCTGDSVNLFEGITGNNDGGVWSPVIPSIVLAQDSIFASAGLAYQTFQFEYRLTDGCAYDSILASVKIFPPSHAGNDGAISVCRNEPFNPLEGLGGNVDLGGTWYNPNGAVVPAGNTIAENVPGQYNYKYIVGNGVCPNDTSKVAVNVTNCNYLGLDEAAFEGFNLYPNPTDGFVYVASGSTEVFSYEVLDLNGRKVMNKENAINGTTVTEIDLNAVETGVYMIHVFNGSAEKTFRVVVK